MTSPRAILKFRKLRAKKHLGQHFLSDPSAAEMIVKRSGIAPKDVVLEIGAGLGALTIPVARVAEKIFAVEKDPQIISLLNVELAAKEISNVVLIEKDILNVNIQECSKDVNRKIIVVGNLPYNISSQILIQLIHARSFVSHAVLMFQKELAQRLTSMPGCKEYGRLTVMLHYCADIKRIAEVKASLFFPRPEVDSEVVEIRFRDTPEYLAEDEAFFFSVVKAAFSKRRKTLKNALAGSELYIEVDTVAEILESVDIDPIRRAETLTVQEFVRLSNRLGHVIS